MIRQQYWLFRFNFTCYFIPAVSIRVLKAWEICHEPQKLLVVSSHFYVSSNSHPIRKGAHKMYGTVESTIILFFLFVIPFPPLPCEKTAWTHTTLHWEYQSSCQRSQKHSTIILIILVYFTCIPFPPHL